MVPYIQNTGDGMPQPRFFFSCLLIRMRARYFPAATRGNSAASASAALAHLPSSARHQLWHLTSPLLHSLLLLALLPLATLA